MGRELFAVFRNSAAGAEQGGGLSLNLGAAGVLAAEAIATVG
jgi:hypothetical protein